MCLVRKFIYRSELWTVGNGYIGVGRTAWSLRVDRLHVDFSVSVHVMVLPETEGYWGHDEVMIGSSGSVTRW